MSHNRLSKFRSNGEIVNRMQQLADGLKDLTDSDFVVCQLSEIMSCARQLQFRNAVQQEEIDRLNMQLAVWKATAEDIIKAEVDHRVQQAALQEIFTIVDAYDA